MIVILLVKMLVLKNLRKYTTTFQEYTNHSVINRIGSEKHQMVMVNLKPIYKYVNNYHYIVMIFIGRFKVEFIMIDDLDDNICGYKIIFQYINSYEVSMHVNTLGNVSYVNFKKSLRNPTTKLDLFKKIMAL